MESLEQNGVTYLYRAGRGSEVGVVVLLHGTGGDEYDLLPLADRLLLTDHFLISPRGPVSEHGLNRFFERQAEDVFDPAVVKRRTVELSEFLLAVLDRHGLSDSLVTAIGYSNGANIAAASMLLSQNVFSKSVLFRALPVWSEVVITQSLAAQALLLSGQSDPLIPESAAVKLRVLLGQAGVEVDHHFLSAGHQLSGRDLELARDWLNTPL